MAPRPRFENLDIAKRTRLLEIAGEEFGAKGFAGASLNQIISRTGISKGAIYYYFDDKADLYETVLGHVLDSLMDLASDLAYEDLDAESFWGVIEDQSRESLRQLRRHPWMVRLMRSALAFGGEEPQGRIRRRVFDVGRRWTMRFLERGQELGVVRDDLPREFLVEFVFTIGLTMDRWTFDHLDSWDESEEEVWIRTMVDLMKRLLEPREEG